jgi:hypothetical protein
MFLVLLYCFVSLGAIAMGLLVYMYTRLPQ